ncbi:MAG: AMP-binding protein [Acetobacteraceae bacterium]|nr:AMP-binding protein [Acetobacteraceae bacterium]
MALTAQPATVPAILGRNAAEYPTATILRKKERGIWKPMTWAELAGQVERVVASLQTIGFQPGDAAGVLAETRPEWVIADLAILSAGGVSVGIPADSEAAEIAEFLRASNCRLLFAENEEQLDKTLAVRVSCPSLERVIIFDMKGLRDFADQGCESFQAFATRGAAAGGSVKSVIALDAPAVQAFSRHGPQQTLTHTDVVRLLDRVKNLGQHHGDERLAILPMDQIIERVFGLYQSLNTLTVSNYLENADTTDENLQELQPTVLGADVAAWNHLKQRADNAANAATRIQRRLYRWAIQAGERGRPYAALARIAVLRPVRRELGLLRLRLAYSGVDAPNPATCRWAKALGFTIRQIDSDPAHEAAEKGHHRALADTSI